jgi:hypothetical protein
MFPFTTSKKCVSTQPLFTWEIITHKRNPSMNVRGRRTRKTHNTLQWLLRLYMCMGCAFTAFAGMQFTHREAGETAEKLTFLFNFKSNINPFFTTIS